VLQPQNNAPVTNDNSDVRERYGPKITSDIMHWHSAPSPASAGADLRPAAELVEGRFPESWIPPAHVVEMRTLGRLCCTLMDERRAWRQRIHTQLFHQGCPPIRALLSKATRTHPYRGSNS